jgi:streptogramin lyase
MIARRLWTMTMALAAGACARGEPASQAPASPITLGADAGFKTPESVLHDPTADVYLVSNINGAPTDKDDNGFISRVSPTGEVLALKWIDGASPEVTLNAPKGTAIRGDTLFVADIDVVRLFDRVSGVPVGAWPVPGATFLNDMAVGPDGTVYVTDSGLKAGANGFEGTGTDAVYRFAGDRPVAIATGEALDHPNGVYADSSGIVVVTFGAGAVYRLDPASGARTDLPKPVQGALDGVFEAADGRLTLSSWNGHTVYQLTDGGTYQAVTDSITSPADIGYDRGRNLLLIPDFMADRVLIEPLK